MRISYLLALLLISFSFTVESAPTAKVAPVASQARAQPVIEASNTEDKALEIQELLNQNRMLEQQNRMLEDYHDSILNTAYWSMGAVFTMAFLLAGFSWLNNNKLYENDKKRAREDFESRISNASNEIEIKEQENRNVLLSTVDKKLDSLANRISPELLDVRSTIESLRQSIEELGQLAATIKADAQKTKSNLIKRLDHGTAVAREIEEHVWQLKKIPNNILITQSQGLAASLAADSEHGVKRVLDRIKNTIDEEYVQKNRKISMNSTGLLVERLTTAQKKHPVEATEVLELLKENLTAAPLGSI